MDRVTAIPIRYLLWAKIISTAPGLEEAACSANSFHCLKSSSSCPNIVFIDFSNSAAAASISPSLKPHLSSEGSLESFGPGSKSFAVLGSLSFSGLLQDEGNFSKSSSAPTENLEIRKRT